jgi:hypothetical protein
MSTTPSSSDDDLLGTAEAAALLGISQKYMAKIADDIPHQVIGGSFVFRRKDVLSYQRNPPGRPPSKGKHK